jgi:serine/threonine protein kinase
LGITAIELATGRPPKSHVPPMKALFLIPKSDPPFLDGDQYSSEFKEFVRVCLQKNPSERPSAKKLLEAKFISKAGHTSILVDLIKRRNIWDLQNQDEQKSKKTKRVYVPSVMGSFNAESTRITFDFENISSENSSEVVIAKTSPLKNNSIKLNYLRENNNLLNMRTGEPQDSILVKRNGSSDLSTAALKRHQPGPLPPVGIELSQIFDKTIKKLQPQESDSRKIQEIKKSFEALDENVLVAFLSELTKNVQNSGVLASKEEENIKPKREESEKLLLKRWSEQYFS